MKFLAWWTAILMGIMATGTTLNKDNLSKKEWITDYIAYLPILIFAIAYIIKY
jgi:uncharacterized membrane protein YdjX (TVP38/TMEM64 family)